MSDGPANQLPIHDYLRRLLAEVFDGNLSRMGERCGATPSMIRKWVTDTVPSPMSCQRIAEAVGADPDDLLAMAGHRAAPLQRAVEGVDPDLVAVTTAWPRLEEGLKRAIKILASTGTAAALVYFVQTPGTPRLAEAS